MHACSQKLNLCFQTEHVAQFLFAAVFSLFLCVLYPRRQNILQVLAGELLVSKAVQKICREPAVCQCSYQGINPVFQIICYHQQLHAALIWTWVASSQIARCTFALNGSFYGLFFCYVYFFNGELQTDGKKSVKMPVCHTQTKHTPPR